jgi:hypothetical protein
MTDGDREVGAIPRPHKISDFLIVFQGMSVQKQWQDCLAVARNATTDAWDALTVAPDRLSPRHVQLRGDLAFRTHQGTALPQWEYKISDGGRLIYLINNDPVTNARGKQTHAGTVILIDASPGHPKHTEKVKGGRKSPGRR